MISKHTEDETYGSLEESDVDDKYPSLPHSLEKLTLSQQARKEAIGENAKEEAVREKRRMRFKKYIEERDEADGAYAMGEATHAADLRWLNDV